MSAPLFDHLKEIRDEISAAHHFALFLDFDGTLAPIVPHPGDADIPPETRRALEISGLDRHFTVHDSVAEALDAGL